MAEQYKVLIIGAGNKGALGPVSHAAAFANNPAFHIAGFVDSDHVNRASAISKWGGGLFASLEAALRFLSVDVAVVATPDETHEEILKQLVGAPAKFIFAEKPFTNNSKTAAALLKEFEAHNQTVMVNYTRRFTGLNCLSEEIQELGGFLGGSAFYTKELHNLCHWVDTFLMLGIDPEAVQYIEIDRSKLNAFEAFLYFEGGRIDILNFGERWRLMPSQAREDYPKERVIACEPRCIIKTWIDKAMTVAVQNIAAHLSRGAPLLQEARDAVKVLEICERLLK